MLDRKNPPVHFQFPEITIPEPETVYLKNGIPVHIFNSTTQPILKIEVIFRNGGSKWDNTAGISQLICKTLQSGTRSYKAQDITNILAQKGAFLDVNSTFDYSTVTLYSLTKYVEDLMPLVKELVSNPTFPDSEIDLQQKISVSNLKIQNKKSSVVASKNFRRAIFGTNSPYGKIITEQSINEIDSKSLKTNFPSFAKGYELIINGNISKSIINLLQHTLGLDQLTLNKADNFIKPESIIPKPHSEHLPFDNAVQTSIRIGKKTIQKTHTDFHKLLISNHLLGGYFGSRLMSNLREDKGLTYGIYSSIVSFNNEAYFVVGSDVNGKDKSLAIDEIKAEINSLSTQLKNSNELKLVKNHLLGSFQSDLSSPLSLSDKFKSVYLFGLSNEYYYKYFRQIEAFNTEDLKYICNKYLNTEDLTCITVGA